MVFALAIEMAIMMAMGIEITLSMTIRFTMVMTSTITMAMVAVRSWLGGSRLLLRGLSARHVQTPGTQNNFVSQSCNYNVLI